MLFTQGFQVLRYGVVLMATAALCMACSQERWETEEPKEALELFIGALYVGNTEVAWHMLPPDVQSELQARADRVNSSVEGQAVKPHQLLASAGFIGPHHITKIQKDKAASPSPEQVTLLVKTDEERTHKVVLTRVDEIWRVDVGALPDGSGVAPVPTNAPEKPTEAKPAEQPAEAAPQAF
ncbi:MAG: hypothetical protein AAFS10_09400 [Myxococcota bacterium]